MKNVLIFSLFLAICLITACNSEDSENSESQNDASTDASDTSDTSDATSTDAGNQIPKTCEDEKDYVYTGYKQCASDAIHRPEATECPKLECTQDAGCYPLYRWCNPDAEEHGYLKCSTDSDCTEKPNGKCVSQNMPNVHCECWYECLKDSDCESNEICLCSGNSCFPAHCKTDADCNGYLCAISSCFDDRGMIRGLYCHTSYDECQGDRDCQNAGTGNMCCYDATIGHWGCYYEED